MTHFSRVRGARRHLKMLLAAGFCSSLVVAAAPAPAGLPEAVALQTQAIEAELTAQQNIDSVHQRTRELVAEQRQVARELAQTRAYRERLAAMVSTQRAQLEALKSQRGQIERTEIALLPLLAEMTNTLTQFVELDLPFLLEERRARAAALRALIDDPDVTVGEKYRRIMAGYQEEAKYGTTLQVYRDALILGGKKRNVEVLRVGRIALIYRTPEGREYGAWNQASRQWQTLPQEQTGALRTAFRVADKQIAPELLTIPLAPPETTR